MHIRLGVFTAVLLGFSMLTPPALAEEREKDLSRLQSLVNTEVTTVSKRKEDPFKAAAAVYVITREDIRRSGATSIPEALRMVPGLEVARAGSERYAISSRGFNDNISNKLLVLIDGRSVYTPVFSGVEWDTVTVPMEDIKQIEVVRGPGGTLWGANAVNGVINIITEEAQNTQENLVSTVVGTEERSVTGRNGGKLGDNAFYRMYATAFELDDTKTPTGDNVRDSWNRLQSGFRVDWDKTSQDNITFQGDIYTGQDDRLATLSTPTPPFANPTIDDAGLHGGNLLTRWTHNYGDGSTTQLQAYFDNFQRNFEVSKIRVSTFDLDLQHSFMLNDRNEVTAGVGYRLVDQDEPYRLYFDFSPTTRTDNLYSTFIQDKIALLPDQVFLTLGSKFEANDYTGFEYQPSARISWLVDDRQTLWASISRAVRTPNRSEDDIVQRIAAIPNTGYVALVGDRNYDSEELIAHEIGYRIRPSTDVTIDTTAFYNKYDNLRTFEFGAPFGDVAVPLVVNNLGKANSYGVELSSTWNVTNKWQLSGGYTFLTMDTDLRPGSTDTELAKDEGRSPKHQFNVRSHLRLPYDTEMDNSLYYVDNLSSIGIPAYLRFDTRVAWQVTDSVELSIVGQNLFDNAHPEFNPIPVLLQSEIERSVYGKVRVRF